MPVRILAISTPLREEQRIHDDVAMTNGIHDVAERSRGQDLATRTWTRACAGGARGGARRCSGGGAQEDGGGSCVRAGGEEEEEEGLAFIGQGPLVPSLATARD
jgi:hypothetical protein